jgi:general secretion pathway protein H
MQGARRLHGFTLIELLVVVVLLGLLTSVAVTTVGSGNQARELEIETNRLHALLRIAADEAVFSSTEIGVAIEDKGYEFLEYNEEERQWAEASSAQLKSYVFPDWVVVDFRRDGEEKTLPKGDDEESREFGEEPAKQPQFMLLSSGEITNFTIGLEVDGHPDLRYEVTLSDQGQIVLPHVEERRNARDGA